MWRLGREMTISAGTIVANRKQGGSSWRGAGKNVSIGSRIYFIKGHSHEIWKIEGEPKPHAQVMVPLRRWSRSGDCSPTDKISLRTFNLGLGSDLGSKGGNKFWSGRYWIRSASAVRWWIKDTVSWRCTPFSIPRKCWPRSCERVVQVQRLYCSRRLCCHLCSSRVLFKKVMHGLVKYKIVTELLNTVNGTVNAWLFTICGDLPTQGLARGRWRMQMLDEHESRQIKSVTRIDRWGWKKGKDDARRWIIKFWLSKQRITLARRVRLSPLLQWEEWVPCP